MGISNTKIVHLIDAIAHTACFAGYFIYWIYILVTKKGTKKTEEEKGLIHARKTGLHYDSIISVLFSIDTLVIIGWLLSLFSAFCYWTLYMDMGTIARPINCEDPACIPPPPTQLLFNGCPMIDIYWLEWLDFGVGLLLLTVLFVLYHIIPNGWFQTLLGIAAVIMTMPIWIILSCWLMHRWWFAGLGIGLFIIYFIFLAYKNAVQTTYGYVMLVFAAIMGVAYGLILVLSPEFGYSIIAEQWISEMCYLIFNVVLRQLIIAFAVITFSYRNSKPVGRGVLPPEGVTHAGATVTMEEGVEEEGTEKTE